MAGAEDQTAALVALMQAGGRAWASYVLAARRAAGTGSVDARLVLEEQLGLLAYEAHAAAAEQIFKWQQRGYSLLTIVDPAYPMNLSVVEGRPPLLFVAGELLASDSHSVALIGTRNPSAAGLEAVHRVSDGLGASGYTIVSGLAAGIDAAAHQAALSAGRRTVAVIGTGLDHVYPPENQALQARIATQGAVVSQFWPDTRPTRQGFPARNAVMSGLTLASVIVEAGPNSGTRIQARHALEQGRQVVLLAAVLEQPWARALAERPGVSVARSAERVVDLLRR